MLRLRHIVLSQFLSSSSASPISQLSRLISAAAPAISPNPSFAVEDYLVTTCGLTRAQALKASAKISHLKSPSKPDAVRAFLTGLGLSGADVAALVAKDPQILCAKVEKTLAPVVIGLTGLGLSRSEIARLVVLCRGQFRCTSIVSNVQYYLHFFDSFESLLPALRHGLCLLSADLETVVKPNVAFLRESGLRDCDIAKLTIAEPWLLTSNLERLRAMVACAEGIGVPCYSGMFRSPAMLGFSSERLQRISEFLISEAGLEPAYIAHRPAMLNYSLKGRIRPRYYVVKYLKENGFLDHDRDLYNTLNTTEKVFMEKFIRPHKEAAPHLAEDYADACKGEVPARFRFA